MKALCFFSTVFFIAALGATDLVTPRLEAQGLGGFTLKRNFVNSDQRDVAQVVGTATQAGVINSGVNTQIVGRSPSGGFVAQPINIAPMPTTATGAPQGVVVDAQGNLVQSGGSGVAVNGLGQPAAAAQNTQYYIGFKDQVVPSIGTRTVRVPVQRLREVEVEQVIMVPKTIKVKKQVPFNTFEEREEQFVTQKTIKVPQYYKTTFTTQVFRGPVVPVENVPGSVLGAAQLAQQHGFTASTGVVPLQQQGAQIPGAQLQGNIGLPEGFQQIPASSVPSGVIPTNIDLQGQGIAIPTGN